jgi:hypothetical protein
LQNNENELLDANDSLSYNHLHIETNQNNLPSDNMPELVVNLEMNNSCKLKLGNKIVSKINELYFLYGFRCILTFHIENKKDIKMELTPRDTRVSLGSITQFYKKLTKYDLEYLTKWKQNYDIQITFTLHGNVIFFGCVNLRQYSPFVVTD